MAAPIKVYERAWETAFTARQVSEIRAEVALTGETASDVIRRAVDAYFEKGAGRRAAKDRGAIAPSA